MTAKKKLEEGKRFYKKQDYKAAIQAYNKAIELDGSLAPPWYGKGLVYDKLKDYEEAMSSFDKAIGLDGNDAPSWYEKGNVYTKLKDYKKALTFYNKAIELDGSYAFFWNEKGNVYDILKDYKKALTFYDKAIELDETYAPPWYGKGNVYDKLKDYEEALSSFDKAIELDETYAPPWSGKGFVYGKSKDYEEALSSYDKAIELDETYAPAWYGKGFVHSELKDNKKALLCFEKAIELDGNDAAAWYGKGTICSALKDYRKALTFYDKAIELDETYAPAWNGKGNVYRSLKDYRKALTFYDKAIELDTYIAPPRLGKGIICAELKDYEEALSSFEKAIELDGNLAPPWSGKGFVYSIQKDYEKALFCFEKAIELDENDAHSWYGKGNAYSELNLFSLSHKCYLRALLIGFSTTTLKNYLNGWKAGLKHPLFIQDAINTDAITSKHSLFLKKEVSTICQNFSFLANYLNKIHPIEYLQPLAVASLFMGHPYKSFLMIREDIIPQSYELKNYYYLIQSCYEFLEDEEPYIEAAVKIAETAKHTIKEVRKRGLKKFLRKTDVTISEEEILQRYYAALIFDIDTEVEAALDCIESIWNKIDFLPIAYLYYFLLFKQQREKVETERNDDDVWTNSDTLKILNQDPFPKIGKYILKVEENNPSEKSFIYGFPKYEIDSIENEWWLPIYHYGHYFEIKEAINLLAIQGRSHFNRKNLVSSESLKPFWQYYKISEVGILSMQQEIRKKERERIGLKFLSEAEEQFKDIAKQINKSPELLEESINYVFHEKWVANDDAIEAYKSLKQRTGVTKNALSNGIAKKIEGKKLGNHLKTALYLISYFFLSKKLTERETIYLQFYAIYTQAFRQKAIPKLVQGGAKDLSKGITGYGFDLVDTALTSTNPLAGLAMLSLKSFAKGSMGELFIEFLKKGPNPNIMMRYAVPVYDNPPYEKMKLASSFKETFLEFIGEEKERLGEQFDQVYPLYGFEEWVEDY